jgi:hypothetical protein
LREACELWGRLFDKAEQFFLENRFNSAKSFVISNPFKRNFLAFIFMVLSALKKSLVDVERYRIFCEISSLTTMTQAESGLFLHLLSGSIDPWSVMKYLTRASCINQMHQCMENSSCAFTEFHETYYL